MTMEFSMEMTTDQALQILISWMPMVTVSGMFAAPRVLTILTRMGMVFRMRGIIVSKYLIVSRKTSMGMGPEMPAIAMMEPALAAGLAN